MARISPKETSRIHVAGKAAPEDQYKCQITILPGRKGAISNMFLLACAFDAYLEPEQIDELIKNLQKIREKPQKG